jgi:hypothetical protein
MGKPKSEEHKKKIREAVKASWTPERREALRQERLGSSNPFFGKHHDEILKERFGARFKGKNNPFFGRKHSRELIEGLSAAREGISYRLKKYGITPEQYAVEIAGGKRWCSYHKGFSRDFPERKRFNSGICSSCLPKFDREQLLRRKYGVSLEWFDQKLLEQGGGCGICGHALPFKGRKHLAIDHCHKSKQTRGILCERCNSALERIEAVADWPEKARAYLTKYVNSSLSSSNSNIPR